MYHRPRHGPEAELSEARIEDETVQALLLDLVRGQEKDLLRVHVVLRLEHEDDKRTAPLAASRERKAAAEAAQPKKVEEKKAEDVGKMESELEDVLENL